MSHPCDVNSSTRTTRPDPSRLVLCANASPPTDANKTTATALSPMPALINDPFGTGRNSDFLMEEAFDKISVFNMHSTRRPARFIAPVARPALVLEIGHEA